MRSQLMWPFLAISFLVAVHSGVLGYSTRRSLALRRNPRMFLLHPDSSHSNFRFVQTKSKIDLMTFVTNVFFPAQEPPEYKRLFKKGGCPRWMMDPRLGPPQLAADWLPASGWSYDVPNQTIIYASSQEAREPPHAFPFNLFLPRRVSSRFALMKRDFFCQGTQIQSSISLNGAKEAGLLFRGVGERNFWAVLLSLGDGVSLVRVKNGERINLGSIGALRVQAGKEYTVNVQEQLGDVSVTVGAEGQEPVKYTRQQEDMEEARPKGYEDSQGAAGLLAGGGQAKFRGTFVGDVNWVPQVQVPQLSQKLKAATTELGKDVSVIFELPEDLANWCPEGALCAGPLYSA